VKFAAGPDAEVEVMYLDNRLALYVMFGPLTV
jgi:hypothetical protein